MMEVLGADWKPIAPFQVIFWMEERVPFVRMSMSRAPLAIRTRFVASITRGRTRWIGSGDVSSSSSGPPGFVSSWFFEGIRATESESEVVDRTRSSLAYRFRRRLDLRYILATGHLGGHASPL
jgi:hypothetical protein